MTIDTTITNSCRVAKSETPHGGTNIPVQVKTIYSDETIAILNDLWVKEFLKRCHALRQELKLKAISDIELLISLLKHYEQRNLKFIVKLKKKGKKVAYFRKDRGGEDDTRI